MIGSKMLRTLLTLFATMGALSSAANAHHSVDLSNTVPVTWTGTITKISWDGAHVMFRLDIENADQHVESWEILGASPKILASRGISKSTFKRGERITVMGHLDRFSRILSPEYFLTPDRRYEMGFYPARMQR